MSDIKYILFDAANTLIHKPALWKNLQSSLKKFNHNVPDEQLKRNHKLLSECIRFPDKTSKLFYQEFNAELLYSIGIVPTQELLDDIFKVCTYLAWEKFSDTKIIDSLKLPVGILSNFSSSLKETTNKEFGDIFKHIFISENYGIGKPDVKFYEIAINEIEFAPNEILYVGDSIKLDMQPALEVGLNPLLIDREDVYPFYRNRISSLDALTLYL